MNQVTLLGRIGADPEVKYFDSGSVVAEVRLATSRKYKDKQGEIKEDTQWHHVVFWGNQAKVVESYVTKGDQILVQGELKYDQWETDQGEKRSKAKVQALRLELLGGSSRNRQQENNSNGESMPNNSNPVVPVAEEDDLPF